MKINSFSLSVKIYNDLTNLYYKRIKFKRLNSKEIEGLMNELQTLRGRVSLVEAIMERGHLYTRVIPKTYIDKIKHKNFLEYTISYGIDLDMFVAIINKIILSIYKYLVKKLMGLQKYTKVIYAYAISTRSSNRAKRHIEVHFSCVVPRGKETEYEEKAERLIRKFNSCAGFDFVNEVFKSNIRFGVGETNAVETYDDTLHFRLFDFNYPGRRLEQPLFKYLGTSYDVPTPGLKAEAVLHVSNWWDKVNKILDVLCKYTNIYY